MSIAGGIVLITVPVYFTLAFRRVYGGSVAMTVLKEGVIGVIYGCVTLVFFIGLLYWVSLGG